MECFYSIIVFLCMYAKVFHHSSQMRLVRIYTLHVMDLSFLYFLNMPGVNLDGYTYFTRTKNIKSKKMAIVDGDVCN